MNNFESKLLDGKKGEETIKRWLESKGNVVTDVSDNKEYQDIDVDFLVTTKKGSTLKFELKTDTRIGETGNAFFEVVNHRQTGDYGGWFSKCQADVLLIYDEKNDTAYSIKFKKAKEYIEAFGRRINWYNYIDKCQQTAILFSIDKLIEKGYAKKHEYIFVF